MAKPKIGLGRGLDALIASSRLSMSAETLNIEQISPNPRQPRHCLDPVALQELADSIRQHGVLQPLLVTRTADGDEDATAKYLLIAGERRWQAAKIAGLTEVPVIIKEATEQQTLELALVENLQRSDLNPLEEATAYRQLADNFGMTQEDIARRGGKQRTTVSNSLRLLNLDEEIKQSLAAGEISEGHARALLGLDDANDRWLLWQRILAQGLSVRQTEEAVRRWPKHRGIPQKVGRLGLDAEMRQIEDKFRAALGTKINLIRGRRGGRLIVHFYSAEELQSIYDKIVK